MAQAHALWRGMRPRQWLKNLLVLAAPLGAGALGDRSVLVASLAAFVAFCLAASGSYLVNDVVDAEVDRQHPVNRHRPVAAGELSPGAAATAAAALIAVGVVGAFATRWQLGVTVGLYVVTTMAYSLWLKHEPVIELALLSMGFLLRAVAGGTSSGIPLSPWFLLVAAFGSLFMAAGKRASERARVDASLSAGPGADADLVARRSLVGYSAGYLRFVWGLAATISVTGYCLWAFDVRADGPGAWWAGLSVLPFVLGVLRYALDIDRGTAEQPEAVVFADPMLLALGLLWLGCVAAGAHAG